MKCLFWLALVYAAILYGIGPLGSFAGGRSEAEKPARAGTEQEPRRDAAAARGAVGAVAKSVAGLCATHAADCLAEAARLTALLEARAVSGSARGDGMALRRGAKGREAPRPIPDPRRQVRAFKLTSKS